MKARHPEKINKKTNTIPKKPSWIRVKLLFQMHLLLQNQSLKKID